MNFYCVERHFICTFIIIWTCMNLSLFELYLKFMTVMYFFFLNLWLNIYFLNNFVNTHEYSWILADIKKIDEYLHNGYPTDMEMSTRQIFIQRVGYGGTTTRPLPIPLTSLPTRIPDFFSWVWGWVWGCTYTRHNTRPRYISILV